jgi:hypothetical protein
LIEESNLVSFTLKMKFSIMCLAVAIAADPLSAAQSPSAQTPEAFNVLMRCKANTDRDARLNCYDNAFAALEQAIASKDVLVTDKAQMKEARRGLFGFSLPKLNLFGSDDDGDAQANEIEATIVRATQLGRNGLWAIYLEGGAKWVQIDGDIFPGPKPGQTIKLSKGAMGSFFGKVNGQRSVRIKREN